MKHKIHQSLVELAIPIEELKLLEGNPRRGNIEAVAASYDEFEQVKPIIIHRSENGDAVVIAGNHQLQAARKLGWTHIAAVELHGDRNKAIAFALADNRTTELGFTDPSLLNNLISEVAEDYSELMDDLGWDMFEMASINEQVKRIEKAQNSEVGYVQPVIVNPVQPQYAVEQTESGTRLVPSQSVDDRQVAISGSTSIGASGVRNAVVQYSLVFDNVEQQNCWYAFTRWLKKETSIDGDTVAERLINFLDAHADYR